MSPLVETQIECPHCGEMYVSVIDTSQGNHETIEDCPVCCRPITVKVICDSGIVHQLEAYPD